MKIKTYSELITLKTFEERFEYLALGKQVFDETFGYRRYLNQVFYTSGLWRSIRDKIIIRDEGCDLGIKDRPLSFVHLKNGSIARASSIYIHHINPLTVDDIEGRTGMLTNPENLICCSYQTHTAIHYGLIDMLIKSELTERTPNDTCPWKNKEIV